MITVVVVEPDRLLCQAITAYLLSRGYRVREASDTPSALAHLQREPAQIVLMDMHPLTESRELMQQIRNLPVYARTPIIAMLASNCALDTLEHLEPGDYLHIPFDMAYLDWMITRLLASQTSSVVSPASHVA